jgi:hypothetical protein
MGLHRFGERLTWDPFFPLPFEAGWSVVEKLCALNHISFLELKSLIRKNDDAGNEVGRQVFGDSSWIDFQRFSKLLRVSEYRLRDGFLDQLGFTPFPRSTRSYGLRTCPRCFSLGYHCTLFDLAIVAECPWHRAPLMSTPLCRAMRGDWQRQIYGEPPLATCALDENDRATIAGYCSSLVEWWKNARGNAVGNERMLRKVCLIGTDEKDDERNWTWHLGYALRVSPCDSAWRFVDTPVDAKVVSWQSVTGWSTQVVLPECEPDSDLGRKYRCIRRRIYRHYVKGHWRCIANLMSLKPLELISLEAKTVCPVALAYLSWRLSVEGGRTLSALRVRPKKYRLGLHVEGHQNFDGDSLVQLNYLNFFGIYHELQQMLGRGSVNVECSNFHHRVAYVEVAHRPSERNNEIDSFTVPTTLMVLVPTWDSVQNSTHRKNAVPCEDLINYRALSNHYSWHWANRDRWRDHVFRAVPSELINRIQYYIQI